MGRKKAIIVLPPNDFELEWVIPEIRGVRSKYCTPESLSSLEVDVGPSHDWELSPVSPDSRL
ncbi:hypothetical protein A2U01_0086802, partial [Trifolium medium]|nr:hypothetical protein [Trifolium medium]